MYLFIKLSSLSSVVAFLTLLLLVNTVGWSQSNLQQTNELPKVTHDTTQVKLLFEKGNLFLDGPSDSLLFYYQKALLLIENNLSEYKRQNADAEIFKRYREFEFRACIELGIEYFFRSNYIKSLDYYFRALTIAGELDDMELISETHSEIGIVYKNQGKTDSALFHSQKALGYARTLPDSSWTSVCYANLGSVYLKKGYFTLALNNYLKALRTFEALDQKRRMSACYLNVGKIYSEQQDNNKALDYYHLALINAKETGNRIDVADSYQSIGKALLNQNQTESARVFLDSALLIFEESGYSHGLDNCYTNLGHTYKTVQNYKKAGEYYRKSLVLSTREDDLPGIAESFNNLAQIEYLEDNFSQALDFSNQSLNNAQESGNLNALKNAWLTRAKIYERMGISDKALENYKQFTLIKDSLFNESKYRSIREAETKFETEKKEQQLELLTNRNEVQQLKLSRRQNLLFISGVGILIVLLVSYLLIRQNRIKAQQKAIVLEQRLLRSQMNPHFIFNSLIAIQSYIYKNEPLQAGDFLSKFAELIRFTLDHSRVEFLPLSDELKMLNAYLDMQVLRFDNKFEYTLNVESDLNSESLEIPPMFAQPFVENAIEHGLRHKQEKGHLVITYVLKNNRCIEITIEDDGVGYAKAKEIGKKKKYRSLAMEITKERLSMLRKKHNYKFILEVTNIEDVGGLCCGTRARISLPFKST